MATSHWTNVSATMSLGVEVIAGHASAAAAQCKSLTNILKCVYNWCGANLGGSKTCKK